MWPRRGSVALRRWAGVRGVAVLRRAGVLLWRRTRCLPRRCLPRCRLVILLRRTTLVVVAALVPPVVVAPLITVVNFVGPSVPLIALGRGRKRASAIAGPVLI